MTDMTDSHSAQFGLKPRDKPTQNAGSGPGSGIEGTSGVAGHKNSVAGTAGTADQNTDVGGVQQSSDTNERPGAGGGVLEPSQGSNKNADSSGGLLNKLKPDPLKK